MYIYLYTITFIGGILKCESKQQNTTYLHRKLVSVSLLGLQFNSEGLNTKAED